jgi:hypothetical protein
MEKKNQDLVLLTQKKEGHDDPTDDASPVARVLCDWLVARLSLTGSQDRRANLGESIMTETEIMSEATIALFKAGKGKYRL